ncbi:MAG TPA: hypothetical protein VHK45_04760, partial [Geminicoccaceae bacterium]|nr:hypothetical protein [Geminicoccaceae bacterium]
FRQEGIVVQRITKRIDADLRVSSPRPGSFLQQIFVAAAPVLADVSIRVPLEALFTYFMGILLPPSRGSDVAVAIARHNVEIERQRTAQEGERTRQIEALAEVANNNNATTQQAPSILQNAQIGALRLPEDMRAMQVEIARMQSKLEAQRAREAEIAPYREVLDQIQKKGGRCTSS